MLTVFLILKTVAGTCSLFNVDCQETGALLTLVRGTLGKVTISSVDLLRFNGSVILKNFQTLGDSVF